MVKKPLIPKGHFYVLVADINTGHILNLNGSIHLSDQDEEIVYFLSGETLNEITQKAQGLLEEREGIEVLIYDSNNNFIKMLKNK